jgi:hypothetical protein
MTAPQNACQVVDRSLTLNNSAQPALPANPYRSFLLIQAPAAIAMTLSFTNATAAAGAAGTIALGTAGTLQFLPPVPQNALTVLGASGVCTILEG